MPDLTPENGSRSSVRVGPTSDAPESHGRWYKNSRPVRTTASVAPHFQWFRICRDELSENAEVKSEFAAGKAGLGEIFGNR